MKTVIAVSLATLYGFSLRIVFGFLNSFMGIMSVSFLVLAPAIIGFLTIFLIPKDKTQSNMGAFFKPWVTSLVILALTIIFSVEGSICWILIYPLFASIAGIGGLLAYHLKKQKTDKADKDNFENKNTLKVSFVMLMPLAIGLVEGDRALTLKEFNISETVIIQASSQNVWRELTNINEIPDNENKFSFSEMMGFPKHLNTTLDTIAVGGNRKAVYENGLYFDEKILKIIPEKLLVLDIKTDPNKIPPTVMDEHIVIGGKHVDILQDIYTIEKLSDTSCRLTLSSRFCINTPFNWYASIWAKYLMADILQSEINLIRERATRTS